MSFRPGGNGFQPRLGGPYPQRRPQRTYYEDEEEGHEQAEEAFYEEEEHCAL